MLRSRSAARRAAYSMGSRGGPLTGFTQRSYGRRVWWKRKPFSGSTVSPRGVITSMRSGAVQRRPGPASSREVRQHGAVTGVQDAKPQRLLVVQPTGVHDDDGRRWGLPSTRHRPRGRSGVASSRPRAADVVRPRATGAAGSSSIAAIRAHRFVSGRAGVCPLGSSDESVSWGWLHAPMLPAVRRARRRLSTGRRPPTDSSELSSLRVPAGSMTNRCFRPPRARRRP